MSPQATNVAFPCWVLASECTALRQSINRLINFPTNGVETAHDKRHRSVLLGQSLWDLYYGGWGIKDTPGKQARPLSPLRDPLAPSYIHHVSAYESVLVKDAAGNRVGNQGLPGQDSSHPLTQRDPLNLCIICMHTVILATATTTDVRVVGRTFLRS